MAREIAQLEEAGVRALHLDVMDGHFVPNLTYGLPYVETLRRLSELPLDAHLMISNPGEYVDRYIDAGADLITIHIEAVDDPVPVLERIRECGAAVGLALNPPTSLDAIKPYVDLCDLILVMSVMPGFGGQAFDAVALDKLRTIRQWAEDAGRDNLRLQVDGGVNDDTISDCAAAGAEFLVVGSAIFAHDDYAERISRLSQLAADAFVQPENVL